MSTRRARIKAVTSLPPRRKNAENAENKNKQAPTKENSDKDATSPKALSAVLEINQESEGNFSVPKNSNEVIEEPKAAIVKTPRPFDKETVATKVDSSIKKIEKNKSTPKHSIKGSDISPSTTKPNLSIFTSPQIRRSSPARKDFTAPLAPSPKHSAKCSDVGQIKIISPQTEKFTPHKQTINVKNELLITYKNVKKVRHNTVSPLINNDISQGYNTPNVPESIADETVMDGIVPLQPASNAPKPIDLLKNDIISENVEVLFDPIVPLPSPSKVRPKLKPVPRLGPLRRNSVQGSASESEDETRRAHMSGGVATPSLARQRHDSHTSHSTLFSMPNREVTRVRNDSICSSVSQVNGHPAFTASPLKEKHNNRFRRQEAASRRMAAMRRKREDVTRDTMTMYDLIFYNPATNPIVPDQDEIEAKEENAKEEAERANLKINKKESDYQAEDGPPADGAPVPQIKLGLNGEIIVDEKSLLIKPTDDGRNIQSVVREGAWGGGGGRYKRGPRTAEWSNAETVRFYRALAAIGTDFTLMAQLFPDRTRKDLKLKFKKEERLNGAQVDKALRSSTAWDALSLKREFDDEREVAKKKEKVENERLEKKKRAERERIRMAKQGRVRNSKASRALETAIVPAVTQKANEVTTADDLLERAMEMNTSRTQGSITSPRYTTLTLINKMQGTPKMIMPSNASNVTTPYSASSSNSTVNTPAVPSNIETGSLVVLTVNDPMSPTKKMLQTYIAHGGGKLTPVALPTTFLNSVVGYMKKGTPIANSSSHFASPNSVTSQESRASATSNVIQMNTNPPKRQRHSSFTITQL